jgi:hypothetical protein
MNLSPAGRAFAVGLMLALLLFGCDGASSARAAQTEKKATEPARKQAAPGQASVAQAPDDTKLEGNKLSLTGINMIVPAEWTGEPIETPGLMAPKAIFKIPNDKGDPGMVRVTYFPGMKGKERDEMNIDRWLAQVTQPDGKPSTREHAKIEISEANGVKFTILDLSGTVKVTMRDTPREGQRLIAAIVDHPKGPHFVVAAGPADLMAKAKDAVIAFIKSAKVD